MSVIYILFVGVIGALLSRWHGGGFFKAPRAVKNITWSLPFAIFTWVATNSILLSAVALLACIAGKSLGHGRVWNPFSKLDESVDPEQVEKLIPFLKGRISDFWYKNIALGLLGVFSVLGPSLAVMSVSPLSGITLLVGGLISKPFSYTIGFYQKSYTSTVIGELGTGFIAYTFLALVSIIIGSPQVR